jgi:hypothetical protein
MRKLRYLLAAHQDSGGASQASGAAVTAAPAPDAPPAAVPAAGEADPEAPAARPPEERRVRRRDLLNLINYVNFREGSIFVRFRNAERGDIVSYQAMPLPCSDERLACRWLIPAVRPESLAGYECAGILISDGQSHVSVEAQLLGMDAEGATFRLPEAGYEREIRSFDRFPCEDIEARLIQSGICFEGALVDFNAASFRVEVRGSPSGSMRWLNPSAPVTALFSKGGTLLYSGECTIRRMSPGRIKRELVLDLASGASRRYPPRRHRGVRLPLTPVPAARFRHPFTGRKIDLQVMDLSAAGMRVEEFLEHSTLLPGLVIPELTIEVGNSPLLSCRAQVLYRNVEAKEGGKGSARCGIVFLDMESQDQARLSALLHQSIDDRLRICGSVDMEELWRFFFESGFIYPSKYLAIHARKDEFKRTYDKLYLKSPSIARHFIFQDKSVIFGHMSMIRFYADSWIIHHHAASRSGYGAAGVEVLDQVGRFVNEFYHHPSSHIDYLLCYYREENRFPSRVFGGVARDIGNPKGSSVDAFSYLHLPEADGPEEPFQLFPARAEDLDEARRSYEKASGGLLFEALDLMGDPDGPEDAALSAEFERQGFMRERRVFCLVAGGGLKALISLALSDMGLNLSNLTNCVHALIVDGQGLSPSVLMAAIRSLLRRYGADDVPVLVFPSSFLDGSAAAKEKEYKLWVLNMEYADGYFDSLNKTFRRKPDAGE